MGHIIQMVLPQLVSEHDITEVIVVLLYKTSKRTMQISFKSNLVKRVISDSSFCFLRMPQRIPFVMTRAKGTEVFLAMLQELMWRANLYAPEYFVYTTKIGPNLVECYAKVLLHPRLMEGALERSHTFYGMGTSPEVAIQVCAYNALTCLRR